MSVPDHLVLIVDDHRAFSDALGIAIDLQPDLSTGTRATWRSARCDA
jgi:hypothetical protein